jgi:predicted dehydrogenase
MTHRIALVGSGTMGALHALVLARTDRAKLIRVIEPSEDAGRACASHFGTQWSAELESLSDVDAVVLASATESHATLAREILAQGKPLLVEKPVAASRYTTEELVTLSASLDVPLMCGLVERFNPAVLTALALSREPVHLLARRHSPYASRVRTGVSWDLLLHDVDVALRLFGTSPSRITAAAGRFHPSSDESAEDTVEAVLTFPSGLATLSASRLGQRKVRSLTIAELDRLIELDLLRQEVTIYRHVPREGLPPGDSPWRPREIIEIPEPVSAREPLAAQLDHFLDLVEGRIDAAKERDSILPAHQVVGTILTHAAFLPPFKG